MSSIEHLFENAMDAVDPSAELDSEMNQIMLKEVGIRKIDMLYLIDYVKCYYKRKEV